MRALHTLRTLHGASWTFGHIHSSSCHWMHVRMSIHICECTCLHPCTCMETGIFHPCACRSFEHKSSRYVLQQMYNVPEQNKMCVFFARRCLRFQNSDLDLHCCRETQGALHFVPTPYNGTAFINYLPQRQCWSFEMGHSCLEMAIITFTTCLWHSFWREHFKVDCQTVIRV